MSERFELVRTIGSALIGESPDSDPTVDYRLAAAILAAGYRKNRTITTVDELEALPVGSVVLDRDGMALQKTQFNLSGTGWNAANGTRDIEREVLAADALPATILYEGATK